MLARVIPDTRFAFLLYMRRGWIAGMAALVALPSLGSAATLSHEDVLWLNRVTDGPTTAVVDRYEKLGRRRFLEEQLHPADVTLPAPIAAQISALDISHSNATDLLMYVSKEQQRINALTDDAVKQSERKTLYDMGNRPAYEAARREILRALYSPAQLQEHRGRSHQGRGRRVVVVGPRRRQAGAGAAVVRVVVVHHVGGDLTEVCLCD